MDHLVKQEEVTGCPTPSSFAGADFALPLDDDAFDFGGMSSLFLDTTCTFVGSFDLFIDDWSESLEAPADPISELTVFGKIEGDAQPSNNNEKVKVEESPEPEPQARPVSRTPKQKPKQKQKSAQMNRRKRDIRTTTTEKPPRKRAKTEILKLRSEIVELHAQLSQLQDGKPRQVGQVETSCPHTAKSLSEASRSLNQAAVELKKLQDTQQLNCCLKSALADKIRVCKAFEAVLETQTHLQTHNFEILQESSETPTPFDLHDLNYLAAPYHH